MGLLVLIYWKDESYNSILVIFDHLTKMIYHELVKIIINILGLVKVIIYTVICHHKVQESIIIDQDLLFTSKFWSSLCYFLGIKKKLFIAFHS